MGVRVSRTLRLAVYERDNWACHLCGLPVRTDLGTGHTWAPSLDHTTPRSRGGKSTAEDMRTAHMWCNTIRGTEALTPGEIPRWATGGPPDDWKQTRSVITERMTEEEAA